MPDSGYEKYYSAPQEIEFIGAITKGDCEAVKTLAGKGVNLCAIGQHESTPMSIALELNQKKIVLLLLQLGVNPNFVTPKGATEAKMAVVAKDPEYLDMFFKFGLDPNLKEVGLPLIFYAASFEKWQQFDMLLAKGADINSKRLNGTSLVLDLVMQFQYDRAKELILKGADFRSASKSGLNVLDELVDMQRRFCADPNHPACRKRVELLRLLQQRGMRIPPGLPGM